MQDGTARQVKRRKDARPGEILEAALSEFAAHGLAGTNLAGIARAAGVSRPTIYLYFKDKDAIFDALLRQQLTDPLTQLSDVLAAYDGTSEDLLRMLIRKLHQDAERTETVTVLRILVAGGHRFPELVRLHHDRVMEVGFGLLRRIVDRGIERGEFAPDIADIDVRVLIAPAIMSMLWRMVFTPVAPMDTEVMIESHLRVILDGLRA